MSARASRLEVAGFRNLVDASIDLGPAPVALVCGANGAGKTNLLEALFFGLTGGSLRTRRDREVIAFGRDVARVVVELDREPPGHTYATAVARGGDRRREEDGAPAPSSIDSRRPAVAVFMPDRLELVKGPPSLRRAHLDQLITALRPALARVRREYARALGQRNALLGRIRRRETSAEELEAWDATLAEAGAQLIAARAEVAGALSGPVAERFSQLGGEEALELSYQPRSQATSAQELARELRERRGSDVERGFTTHGPHLDELRIARGGRLARTYASQGQQRLAVLSLLLAERELLATAGRPRPILLLDDVMSELDPTRRELLVDAVCDGQAVITATDHEHVPGEVARSLIRVEAGRVEAPG